MSLKAIETVYRGCRFRSRTEARWAVFFDHIWIRWSFEQQGYQLQDGTRYLPDFEFHDQKLFVEVKPGEPTDEEQNICRRLAKESGNAVAILGGSPYQERGEATYQAWLYSARFPQGQDGWRFATCHQCGTAALILPLVHSNLRPVQWVRSPEKHRTGENKETCWLDDASAAVTAAYAAATSARFEHGEQPAPAPPRLVSRRQVDALRARINDAGVTEPAFCHATGLLSLDAITEDGFEAAASRMSLIEETLAAELCARARVIRQRLAVLGIEEVRLAGSTSSYLDLDEPRPQDRSIYEEAERILDKWEQSDCPALGIKPVRPSV